MNKTKLTKETIKSYYIDKKLLEKYLNHVEYYHDKEQCTIEELLELVRLLQYRVVDFLGQICKLEERCNDEW